MKKICIIAPNALPVPAVKGGAVETLVNNLIDENEKNKKFDFCVITIKDIDAIEKAQKYNNTKFEFINVIGNIKIEKIKHKFEKNSFSHKVVRKLLKINEYIYAKKVYNHFKKKKYDYVIVEGGNPYAYAKILKKIGKEKCIYHLHGNTVGDNFYKKYFNYFIAISKFVKEKFIENNIVDSSKVYVINNGIALEKFALKLNENEKSIEKKKYKIEENKVVIEFCGRTIPEKGVMELIKAFKKMKNIDKCILLIVGNSQFGNNIVTEYDKKLIEETDGIEDKIKFTGYVHNDKLYKIYGISDISVIPSIWDEPSGLVVMEAMSSGLPIITTNSGGIPELINDKCAFMIERDSNIIENLALALDNLVENSKLRKVMGENGKEESKKYSTEKYFYNFQNFVKKISE